MADGGGTRERILEATYRCVARDGVRATTMEAAAREAGVVRATVYRYFPGGRDELVKAVVSWEVGRFFSGLAADVPDTTDFALWVERTLAAARRRLDRHEVLNAALLHDAGQVVPALAQVLPIVLGLLREQVAVRLRDDVAPEDLAGGVDVDEAADLVARMMLSFIGTPGVWRLDRPDELRRMVRGHLLAGVLRPGAERQTTG